MSLLAAALLSCAVPASSCRVTRIRLPRDGGDGRDSALVGRVVDAIERGDRDAILPLVGLIVGAGILRLLLSVSRRLIAGRVSLSVEYDLRNRMYGHLQRLELGFFDGQQVGQLMSRATVDLQSVRFFLGYGLIFIVQNLLTILLAPIAMLFIKPSLALITLAPVLLVIATAFRYGRFSRPALQEVQQRIAELTAEVEKTSPASGSSRRSHASLSSSTVSPVASAACSIRACSPPGCVPTTTR